VVSACRSCASARWTFRCGLWLQRPAVHASPHAPHLPQDFQALAATSPAVFAAAGTSSEDALAKMRMMALMGLAHASTDVSFVDIEVVWGMGGGGAWGRAC
jgi:hypothetical protein